MDPKYDLFLGFVVASCVAAIGRWLNMPWYAQAAVAVLLTMHFLLKRK